MLTIEQIQEGRARLHRAVCGRPGAVEDLGAWFEEHGQWLLDLAALSVRSDEASRRAGVAYDQVAAFPAPLGAAASPGARFASMLGDDAARARLAELATEAHEVFAAAPVTLDEIQRWYAARGLLVHLKIVGDQLMYDFVGLIEPAAPVIEGQPDGHTRVRVR